MTYGVLPLTYRVYQEMLPDLTAEQKAKILGWLTEAREQAMDAGTAKAKHGWFTRYKGKINNYLSAAGYDMKKAEKALMERQKAAREAERGREAWTLGQGMKKPVAGCYGRLTRWKGGGDVVYMALL